MRAPFSSTIPGFWISVRSGQILVGLALGALAGWRQRVDHRQDQHPALHRHAWHDGVSPRPGQMVHRKASRSRCCTRVSPGSARALTVLGFPVPRPVIVFLIVAPIFHIALVLYPLWQVHLRHRRQSAGRPRLRHQHRQPSDQGLHGRRTAFGPCRCHDGSARPVRPARHGRRL